MNTADLEIAVRRTQIDAYSVELRFNYENHADVNASCEGTLQADYGHLLEYESELKEYGRHLTEYFFEDAKIRDTFLSAVNAAAANGDRCRLRFFISNTALELQKLRWELLERPDNRERLSTSNYILFSRYLFSGDFRAVQLRPLGNIRVLIAVSTLTPEHVSQFKLAPLDAAVEIARAQKAFCGLSSNVIGADRPLTMAKLWDELRKEEYDILYLLGHGTSQRRPMFFIERSDPAKPPFAEPQEFVDRFTELLRVPRLVVLGSCQSSFTNMALGPRLVEAGIPAVVAMQDSISLSTLESFTTTLFSELTKHGAIDHAVAAARDAIRDREDCWMPVLFSRLKNNRIWFDAGFTSQPSTPAFWNTIIDRAKRAKIVPVIGPSFGDYIHGDLRDLAKNIIDTHKLPRLLSATDSFPQVCQSLLAFVGGERDTVINHVRQAIREQVQRYHASLIAKERFAHAEFQDLLWEVRQALPRKDRRDAYGLLAELDVPVYVTTTRDLLLARTLQEKGKEPQVVECPWRGDNTSPLALEPPTTEKPIVYHVFGTFQNEERLVLTEEDYFEFLIEATNNRDLIPEVIRSKTMHGSLAFLGFHLTDWSLRVLQYIFKSQQSRQALGRHVHVAVQLNRADDIQSQNIHLAAFLAAMIAEFGNVQIFWGRPEDFLSQLLTGLTGSSTSSVPLSQAA
jgi:CHAT domain/SIR2-like domain